MTTIFNNLILAVARKLKDSRTAADSSVDTGRRYTSALLSEYVNRSIRDFLIDSYQKYGEKTFIDLFPEYIGTSGSIALSAGVGAKPSDCFTILNIKASDNSVKFRKVSQNIVEDIITGVDKIIVPSATKPVFYEEGSNFKTLGLSTGNVVLRYIKTHVDIVPTTGSPNTGKYLATATNTTYNATTRVIAVAIMSVDFATTDVGKKLVLRANNIVYDGTIDSFVGVQSITVSGLNLPLANVTAGNLTEILVIDKDILDLPLNAYWHSEVVERAVGYGLQDAKNFVA